MVLRFLPSVLLLSLFLSSQEKTKEPKADTAADLAALMKDLEKAEKEKVPEIVQAFAQKHRPSKDKVSVLTSADKKIHVAIGANGSEKSPDGADVEFTPLGSAYNLAVGGQGFDSPSGDGGNGGSVVLKAKTKGITVLIGGRGGKGADGKAKESGKNGGNGGNVWFGKHLRDGDRAIGGSAGVAGNGGEGGGAGGSGGRAGSAGPEPPK
jgi:hypothetical protein